MPDPTYHFFRELWDAAKYIIVALLGVLGWNARRQIKRVDKIEENYVGKDTFNYTLKSLREDLNNGIGAIREDLRGIHTRIDNIKDKQ